MGPNRPSPPILVNPIGQYWPPNFSAPRRVTCDRDEARAFALLAGRLGESGYGWHSFQAFYPTVEVAMQVVTDEWHRKGYWWQIVNLATGQIEASGSIQVRP